MFHSTLVLGGFYLPAGIPGVTGNYGGNGKFLAKWGSLGSGDGQFEFFEASYGGLAVDGQGAVYVPDSLNGSFLTRWGIPASDAGQLAGPSGIVVDGQGNVYVADESNNRILKFRQK